MQAHHFKEFECALILPFYNEIQRIPFQELETAQKANPQTLFLFVDDGSSDKTSELLTKKFSQNKNFKLLQFQKNQGKAEAIRKGVLSIANREIKFIGYWDTDGATPVEIYKDFLKKLRDSKDYDLIMGLRLKRLGAKVERKLSRHYLGRIFATLTSTLLNLPAYDTQCGAKLMRRDFADQVFEKPFLTKWLFDIEILFRAKHGFPNKNLENSVLELPLDKWREQHGSKLRLLDFLKTPFSLLALGFVYSREFRIAIFLFLMILLGFFLFIGV